MVEAKLELSAELKESSNKKMKQNMKNNTSDAITNGIEEGLKNSKSKVKNWSTQLKAALRDLEKSINKADLLKLKGSTIDTETYKNQLGTGTWDAVVNHGAGATKEEVELIKDANNQLQIQIEREKELISINEERTRNIQASSEAYSKAKAENTRADESLIASLDRANNKLQDSHQIMKNDAIQNYAKKLENLKESYEEITSISPKTTEGYKTQTEAMRGLRAQVLSYTRELSQSMKTEKSWGKEIATQTKKLFTYLTASKLINTASQAIRSLIKEIVNLDEAFTNIQMVTSYTNEEISTLRQQYTKLAQELSSTVTEVAEGANNWLRMGLSIEETNEALRASIMLSKIAGMTNEEASKALISAMKGYKLEAEDLESVVDKLSAVDMAAATSSEDIAAGLSEVSSMASNAGVSMDNLIGYIAEIAQVTQSSGAEVGNTLKTIFARMQNVKLGRYLDDEGESISDVEKILNEYGIKLRDTENEWKSMDDVLGELGENWDKFSSVQKSAIAVQVAGKQMPCARIYRNV